MGDNRLQRTLVIYYLMIEAKIIFHLTSDQERRRGLLSQPININSIIMLTVAQSAEVSNQAIIHHDKLRYPKPTVYLPLNTLNFEDFGLQSSEKAS